MKSYGQYCALAKALDVIGDRWTLLIVRELLIRGACRYTDLREWLPGIATNLLATRLDELEKAGVIERYDAPPPIATALFRLTPRGQELQAVLNVVGRWGHPFMKSAPKSDAFCSHWIVLPAMNALQDHRPDRPPIAIELRAGDEPVTVEAGGGKVRVRTGAADNPDAVMSGPPRLVIAVIRGEMDLVQARKAGLRYDGKPDALKRVQPNAFREA
jgi:DNA-binding HxlR family transcriptional regulator